VNAASFYCAVLAARANQSLVVMNIVDLASVEINLGFLDQDHLPVARIISSQILNILLCGTYLHSSSVRNIMVLDQCLKFSV
jgi:hypothetical protein